MLESLSVDDGSAYTGMDGYFGNNELMAAKPISFTEYFRTLQQSADAYAEEFGDQEDNEEIINDLMPEFLGIDSDNVDPDKEYFMVPVIGDGEYGEGVLIIMKDGKNWVLNDFSRR